MLSIRALLSCLLLAATVTPLAAVTISQFNNAYGEDFDSLANTSTSSALPAGWEMNETGSSANTTYSAGTGSSTTGNTYSFGATSATDRALGALRTSGVAATFGSVVLNQTGSTITQLTLQFTGEQWRLGALGRMDRLDFGYSLDGTSIVTGTWLDVDQLDFVGPVTSGVVGPLDGNAVENQFLVSHTITGLSLINGASLWLRWVDFDASGSDDGLGIDNFSIIASQDGGGGGGGGGESVPDNLPMSAVVITLGGVLLLASRSSGMRFV